MQMEMIVPLYLVPSHTTLKKNVCNVSEIP